VVIQKLLGVEIQKLLGVSSGDTEAVTKEEWRYRSCKE
jgi:hypothetical protein